MSQLILIELIFLDKMILLKYDQLSVWYETNFTFSSLDITRLKYPVDTGCKLNVPKTFRRRPGRLRNVLCTFNLRPMSTGLLEGGVFSDFSINGAPLTVS